MYNQFQIFNLISFTMCYKCPKKGHSTKMGIVIQKVSHLSVHSSLHECISYSLPGSDLDNLSLDQQQ
jgi:hypothetical protein